MFVSNGSLEVPYIQFYAPLINTVLLLEVHPQMAAEF